VGQGVAQHTEEGVNGKGPICYSFHLYWIHGHLSFADDDSQKFHFWLFKDGLLQFEVEVMFFQLPQHLVYHLSVVFQVIDSGDKDIIDVNHYYSQVDLFSKDGIHHCLEGARGVGETKEHYQGFQESLVCLECCLPLISFLDAYIVVPPADVEFSEEFCLSEVLLV
jgi:hypothetical protein